MLKCQAQSQLQPVPPSNVSLHDGEERKIKAAKLRQEQFHNRILPDKLLEGWNDWWNMVERDTMEDGKRRTLCRAAESHAHFENRVKPDLIFLGWRGWWSRMLAEVRKEESRETKSLKLDLQKENDKKS